MVNQSIFKVQCKTCGSNAMKQRRVDDDKPGSDNGTTFNDPLLDCSHFTVVSQTYCCNVYNPFSSLNDTIRWQVTTVCKKCNNKYTSQSEKQSTQNGEDCGDIKCECSNKGIAWVCIFGPWGHIELTKYLTDKLIELATSVV